MKTTEIQVLCLLWIVISRTTSSCSLSARAVPRSSPRSCIRSMNRKSGITRGTPSLRTSAPGHTRRADWPGVAFRRACRLHSQNIRYRGILPKSAQTPNDSSKMTATFADCHKGSQFLIQFIMPVSVRYICFQRFIKRRFFFQDVSAQVHFRHSRQWASAKTEASGIS